MPSARGMSRAPPYPGTPGRRVSPPPTPSAEGPSGVDAAAPDRHRQPYSATFRRRAGLALRTLQHVDIRETLSLSADGTGPTLRGLAHFEEHFEYPIPGDLSSRTDTYTGLDLHVTGPGVGLVVHDVGLKTFDIDDNVLAAHGPHPILEDFEGTFAQLCDAFAVTGG